MSTSIVDELRTRAADADAAAKFLSFIKPVNAGEPLSAVLLQAAAHIERLQAEIAALTSASSSEDSK